MQKVHQNPAFGAPIPGDFFRLIGEENREYFLQARRSVARGLGIGAYSYYRRIIENSKLNLVSAVLLYDTGFAAPIVRLAENDLIPCESLYVAFEVKSVLSRAEIEKCLLSAEKLRALRPFKGRFVSSRNKGMHVQEKTHRFLYIVFAYETDLSADGWLAKEQGRLAEVAAETKTDPSMIDRIFVVDRGIIKPPTKQGKLVDADSDLLFLELFLHVVEFVEREKGRRPPIDWRIYALPKSRGWKAI